MARADNQAPTNRRIAARKLDSEAVVGFHVEFVPAKPPGLQAPIKSRLAKFVMESFGVASPGLGFVLLRAKPRLQRNRPLDHRIRRQIGFRDANRLLADGGAHSFVPWQFLLAIFGQGSFSATRESGRNPSPGSEFPPRSA